MSEHKLEKLKYKNAFKEYYNQMNDYIKTQDSHLTVEQRKYNFLQNCLRTFSQLHPTSSLSQQDIDRSAYYFNTFVLDLQKKLPHIFIENKELEDFFINTKIHNSDTVKAYIEANTQPGPYNDNRTKDLSYVLHTPEDVYIVKAAFREHKVNDKDFKEYFVMVWDNKAFLNTLEFNNFEKTEADKIINSGNASKYLKVAFNSMMYMSAFPDCLIKGVPQNIVKGDKDNFKDKVNITLKTAEAIVEKCERDASGRIVTPHFRNGSFHFLNSDYYKDKKGKTVWWSPSMVKGRAKTLKDSKDKDEEFDVTR